MASLIELLIRLEKRLIAVEIALGITPDIVNLVHPKSMRQAETVKETVRVQEELS
jgi:hypothetical protein